MIQNLFQHGYEVIFKEWFFMRQNLIGKDIEIKCVDVDRWWQAVPIVNHYLHSDFVHEWPNPWELISDNHYCYLARGLGMVYTLHLLGEKNIEFVEARDYNNEDVALVLVDNAKYILNYWPETVLNNKLIDFNIVKKINTSAIISKIGLK